MKEQSKKIQKWFRYWKIKRKVIEFATESDIKVMDAK